MDTPPSPRHAPLRLFISAGEPSGDVHGANLLRAFRQQCPDVECLGFGGPKMRDAGCEILYDLTTLAVMWLGQALGKLRTFFRLADLAEQRLADGRFHAVILIDYPGFHWHIARRARRLGIPVYYYSPPQVWAWKQGRVRKLRRDFRRVFSGLPFETRWLEERGVNVTYVGHPFFDEVQTPDVAQTPGELETPAAPNPESARDPLLVGLLPGSRTQEVRNNFPVFLRVVKRLQERVPGVHFEVAAFREEHARLVRELLHDAGLDAGPVRVCVGETRRVMRRARCCLAVSGSVSLELLHHETPTVVTYQVPCWAWVVQWLFRHARFITLVNLLATDRPFRRFNPEFRPGSEDAREAIFPEYLVWRDRSAWIADDLARWLTDHDALASATEALRAVKRDFACPGAAARTVTEILRDLAHFT